MNSMNLALDRFFLNLEYNDPTAVKIAWCIYGILCIISYYILKFTDNNKKYTINEFLTRIILSLFFGFVIPFVIMLIAFIGYTIYLIIIQDYIAVLIVLAIIGIIVIWIFYGHKKLPKWL